VCIEEVILTKNENHIINNNWIKAIEINQETFCKPIISIKEVFSQSAVLDYAGY
jgi:hypothetical protein